MGGYCLKIEGVYVKLEQCMYIYIYTYVCVYIYIYYISRKRHVLIHPYSMRYALSGESHKSLF